MTKLEKIKIIIIFSNSPEISYYLSLKKLLLYIKKKN